MTDFKNFVGIFENAYSLEYCKSAIDNFEVAAKNGFGYTRQQADSMPKTKKDDVAMFSHSFSKEQDMYAYSLSQDIGRTFNDEFWGKHYRKYADHFSVLDEASQHAIYVNKIQKTLVGGGYHLWHFESMSRDTASRVLTYILYLNDVEEGGETEFLYYPMRVKPKAGTLVIFPSGLTHTHRGNPPISNDKYIITGWTEF